MGFDFTKLKWITNLLDNGDFEFYVSVNDIKIMTNVPEFQNMFYVKERFLDFKPHPGWQGYVELV